MTARVLERFADLPLPYSFTQGPEQVPDEQVAQRQGLNCIALAHLAIKDMFGHSLPPELHCYEMFSDTTRFRTVDALEDMRTGDLAWFGPRSPQVALEDYRPSYDATGALVNWRDNPIKHVAICVAQNNDDFDMLHATHIEGGTAIWPLRRFAEYSRYERLYKVSRFAPPAAA